MYEMLAGLICFVTMSVSLIFGTRITWHYGRKCQFRELAGDRKQILRGIFPVAVLIYSLGFISLFSLIFDGFGTILLYAFTSAVVLTAMVFSIAMPEMTRRPAHPFAPMEEDIPDNDKGWENDEDDDTSSFLR